MTTTQLPSQSIIDQINDSSDTSGPHVVILYNDNWHPFDEVVLQVQKATGYALVRAVAVTMEAHRTGRAVAYKGEREECERVANVLRAIKLQVETCPM